MHSRRLFQVQISNNYVDIKIFINFGKAQFSKHSTCKQNGNINQKRDSNFLAKMIN